MSKKRGRPVKVNKDSISRFIELKCPNCKDDNWAYFYSPGEYRVDPLPDLSQCGKCGLIIRRVNKDEYAIFIQDKKRGSIKFD